MADSIEERVSKIIVEQLEVPADKIVASASFTEDLKADSLAIVELPRGLAATQSSRSAVVASSSGSADRPQRQACYQRTLWLGSMNAAVF